MNMENFLLESFDLASIYDITTGELYALCDQIKDGSLENTVDSSDVTGKMLLASLDRNKAATITWNNAFLVAGLLAAQAGTDIEEASEDNKIQVPNFERVELDTDTTAKLSYVPVGVEGAEVKRIWLLQAMARRVLSTLLLLTPRLRASPSLLMLQRRPSPSQLMI